MDSITLLGLLIGVVVLWKIVSFVRSAISSSKRSCTCSRFTGTYAPEYTQPAAMNPGRNPPLRTEAHAPLPVRVYPHVVTPAAAPANRSAQDVPAINRYGELED